jgi:hypothetical protein
MKRIVIALLVLSSATGSFCGLRTATARARHESAGLREKCETHTQSVDKALSERTELEERAHELKRRLASAKPDRERVRIATMIRSAGNALTPEERERFLADLGFDWNSTGDFLVVSKQTLETVGFPGAKGDRLTGVVCDVLAITADERRVIETTMRQIMVDYKAWLESHVRREEPAGDVLAKYSLTPESEISQSLSNRFVSEVFATLGRERGDLLKRYSSDWMTGLGMQGASWPSSDVTMTVKRYGSTEQPHLNLEVRQAGNTMSTDVSPSQQFPEAFKPLFPGGWKDLAAREGFELPKEFQKATKSR